MKIVDRISFNHNDGIFIRTDCLECEDMQFTGNFMHYYGINGYLGDEERNNGMN